MVCIAVTGAISSGKSTFSRYVVDQYGYAVLDADEVVSRIYRDDIAVRDALQKRFGSEVMDPSGVVNRHYLRQAIYADPLDRAYVESLVHPLVRDKLLAFKKKFQQYYVFGMVPLLYETGSWHVYDRVVVIDADTSVCYRRCLARGMEPEIIKNIQFVQSERGARLKIADDIIYNMRTKLFFYQQIDRMVLYHRNRFGGVYFQYNKR